MGRKKGQITVFMIIGIIALVSVAVFFYIRTIKVEAPITYRPTIEQIPVEAEPLREFVSACVEKVAEDGLKRIGDYGGYTSREGMHASVNPALPTQGNAVQFSPGSSLVIPFWWYVEGATDCEKTKSCTLASKRPGLYRTEGGLNIEGQLDDYVNENLKTCLRDFVDFAEYGFTISEAGDVDTKTVITQDTVAFHVRYPLIAEKAGVTYELNEYFVDIPLNLREIYKFATAIINQLAKTNFLDRYLTRVLAFYMGVDKNKLPPTSGSGIDTSGGVRWIKSEVKEKVKRIFMSYIPMLKVFGTRNWVPIVPEEETPRTAAVLMIYNKLMLVPPFNETFSEEHFHPDLSVSFVYLDWWDTYFNLNCDGICGPMKMDSMLPIIGSTFMQRYQFNYDFSVPVLVDIVNPDAFLGRGYSFKYFIEANVRDNRPLAEMPEGFELGYPSVGRTGTMICDMNKWTDEEFTIRVIDTVTGGAVPDVNVKYTCGRETCNIGPTGSGEKLTSQFPKCAGGMLRLQKKGYIDGGGVLSTTVPRAGVIDAQLNPILKIDVEVKKYKIRKILGQWAPVHGASHLSGTEEAIVSMIRHPGPVEEEFSAFAEYAGDRSLEDSSKNVSIAPGTYDIEISLIDRQEFIIPEDTRTVEVDWPGEDVEYTIDEMEFNKKKPFSGGGASLENVAISVVDLAVSDKIIFYVVAIDLPGVPESLRVIEDMDQIDNIDTYAAMYGDLMLPEYET